MSLPAITIIGATDSGKSTLIGALLLATKSLPKNLVKRVQNLCEAEGLVFEPAFLVDYIREEVALKSTRERALVEIKIGKAKVLIIDTPGQLMLSKKMISGLTEANMAVILMDMRSGNIDEYRYYLKLVSLLDFSEVILVINKLDLFKYKKRDYEEFLAKIGATPEKNFHIIPVSALKNENLVRPSKSLSWHRQGHLLQKVQELIKKNAKGDDRRGLLLPVQSVLDAGGGRMILGKVLAGRISAGETAAVFSAGGIKKYKVKNIYHGDKAVANAAEGQNAGVVFDADNDIKRGDILFSDKNARPSFTAGAGMYAVEPFSSENIAGLNLRYLNGIYEIKKLKINHCFDFKLQSIAEKGGDIFPNEFLELDLVLAEKILLVSNKEAKKIAIEDAASRIVAIGMLK
jgi:sulfate adenylyltransferase subunit 1 (EFTu-like GTPase family)